MLKVAILFSVLLIEISLSASSLNVGKTAILIEKHSEHEDGDFNFGPNPADG